MVLANDKQIEIAIRAQSRPQSRRLATPRLPGPQRLRCWRPSPGPVCGAAL